MGGSRLQKAVQFMGRSNGVLTGNCLRLIELPRQEIEPLPELKHLGLNFIALLFVFHGIQEPQNCFVAALGAAECSFRRAALSRFNLVLSQTGKHKTRIEIVSYQLTANPCFGPWLTDSLLFLGNHNFLLKFRVAIAINVVTLKRCSAPVCEMTGKMQALRYRYVTAHERRIA